MNTPNQIEQQKSWLQEAEKIEKKPRWLKPGDRVQVSYGKWTVEITENTNKTNGSKWTSQIFTLEVMTKTGDIEYINVNEKDFLGIIRKFKADFPRGSKQTIEDYEKSLIGQEIVYRRPINN